MMVSENYFLKIVILRELELEIFELLKLNFKKFVKMIFDELILIGLCFISFMNQDLIHRQKIRLLEHYD
jgi:hypothetical protein